MAEPAPPVAAVDPSIFRGHIPELNAIRAFGIVIVVLAHTLPVPSLAVTLFRASWIAMDWFFVLSGFLIGGILLDSRTRPGYYKTFYTRRALRILPIYYVVITSMTLPLVFWGGEMYRQTIENWGSLWYFFVYIGNLPTAWHGAWPEVAGRAFSPLWSLQIEEQFYLLFPVLVRVLEPRTLGRVLWGLVGVSLIARLVIYAVAPGNELAQYVLLPCRMDGLALGGLIALRFRQGPWHIDRRRLTVSTLLCLVVTLSATAYGGLFCQTPFNRTIGISISCIFAAHLVLWLIAFRNTRATACLKTWPVQHLANASYCMYLVHFPVIVALAAASEALGSSALSEGYWKVPAVLIVVIGVASLSWRYFEEPMLRLRTRFGA